ncbi:PhnA domain-containing protein [Ulvibacter litoralis]|uniref:Phosphonoacetate hydrolase n=1 Tax=Ulvibacter litoralis TaxID=227084 RepID=A0A1G7CJN1_9FLAO|nr:alkylphosphonate utilization protein [Ulvibacter litoralis]GHC47094.1 PhnA protein [Ulvibacter litoralis]SDE39537.1 phosphonoacetate hydrolase [Ulvibacter litoralis]
MSLERRLKQRSDSKCEFCASPEKLSVYEVPKSPKGDLEGAILLCGTCLGQIENPETVDPNHWRCLNDSMWSPELPVQVMAWRMLQRLKAEGWPQGLIDMMYFEEDVQEWAEAEGDGVDQSDALVHRDSNGVILQAGDSVVLIKDLKVKGSSMVAKQGTAVRRISLDHENETYIEGKVDGQQIVIITEYVKKL